ncbi:hypothetical protein GGF43_001423 [Coemansia sp. RSA 2618]|nr:hypothetical protein GGF43_001423 [Coemansia sp. RSA 2618]
METTGVAAATGGREEQHVSSPAPALEEHRKRRRLNVTDEQAHARVESILREQLDLELYMKQKEVNTISSRLKHSEALLEVLESAIQSQQNAAQASDDAADGFLSYFHNLSEFSHTLTMRPARESRFHIIRRVMLGNTSQFFDPQSRPLGKERSTHKWTLYIRNAPTEDHIGSYIRKARVFLHPSYRPDDIVDLSPPRFELTRWGWGEFPARVQIFFRDKRNKPVDLVHILKLDDMCSGIEVLGQECESTSASAHTTATNIGGVLTTLPKGWDASEDEGGAEF